MEVNSTGEIQQGEDPLFFKIKNFILQNYEPVSDPVEATLRMSSVDMYNAMQRLYPSGVYTVDMVAVWLHEKGFSFWDAGELRFEWLLKTA